MVGYSYGEILSDGILSRRDVFGNLSRWEIVVVGYCHGGILSFGSMS